MPRKIREGYYEDNYLKYECHACRKSFIVGETLSGGVPPACPYCVAREAEQVAGADEDCTGDMDMGCLGIYFGRYGDGSLMLYTEKEFAQSLAEGVEKGLCPLDAVKLFCSKRDIK